MAFTTVEDFNWWNKGKNILAVVMICHSSQSHYGGNRRDCFWSAYELDPFRQFIALVHLCNTEVWSVLGRIMAIKALAQQVHLMAYLELSCWTVHVLVLPLPGCVCSQIHLWHHWASHSQSRCFGPHSCHCSTWQGGWISILALQSWYSRIISPNQKLWTHRDLGYL